MRLAKITDSVPARVAGWDSSLFCVSVLLVSEEFAVADLSRLLGLLVYINVSHARYEFAAAHCIF